LTNADMDIMDLDAPNHAQIIAKRMQLSDKLYVGLITGYV